MEDFLGKLVKVLEPSSPASVIGFDGIPSSGEEFVTGDNELNKDAKNFFIQKDTIDGEGEKPKAILKASSKGSIDALIGILAGEVEIVESSVGEITGRVVEKIPFSKKIIKKYLDYVVENYG